jgi:hypothetical protein
MRWSIAYRVVGRRFSWNEDELRRLREHADRWRGRLSRGASGYDVSGLPATDELTAATTPGSGRDAARDYLALVRALAELEALFPGVEAYVSDEVFVRLPQRPRQIDLAALRREVLRELDPVEDTDALEDALARARAAYREWVVSICLRKKLEEARRDFLLWKRSRARDDSRAPSSRGKALAKK